MSRSRSGDVARTFGQQIQPVLQASQQRARRQDREPGGSQFDRQRQPIEPVADRIDDRDVLRCEDKVRDECPGPRDKELPGIGPLEGIQGVDLLGGNPEPGPARAEDGQSRTPAEEISDDGRDRIQQVLGVVEHEQRDPIRQEPLYLCQQRLAGGIRNVQRPGDGRHDQGRLANGGKGDDCDAIRESVIQVRDGAEGEAGLADATGSGQRQQTDVWPAQEGDDSRHLLVPADERGHRCEDGCGPGVGGIDHRWFLARTVRWCSRPIVRFGVARGQMRECPIIGCPGSRRPRTLP